MPTISGTVYDSTGAAASGRVVRVYRRDTGAFLGSMTTGDGVAVPGDTHYGSVSLLLHFSGDNNATNFVDSSSSPKTVTPYGNAKISTAQSKFGGSSGAFDGSGDYLTVPDNTAFSFGTGDWTIEMFYRPSALDVVRSLIGKAVGTGFYPFNIRVTTAGKVVGYCTDGASSFVTPESGGSLAVGAWAHIAFVRSSNALRMYVDGVATGAAVSMSTALQSNAAPLCIGGFSADYSAGAGSGVGANGHLDALRITKGVARYTSDFTPPASAFIADTEIPAIPLGTYEIDSGGYAGEVQRIVLDDDAGTLYNDLIDRVLLA